MTDLELKSAVYAEIQNRCSNGDDLLEHGNIEDAILAYNQAWQLMPDTKISGKHRHGYWPQLPTHHSKVDI